MGLEKPDPSVVSTSSIGGDKSMLSLQTDKSSYSIPDDGRAITIETNKKHHKKNQSIDEQSAVSQNSQTSLLIEYFEGARGQGSTPSHRPSVRVKVTPSHRRNQHQAAKAVELGTDGRPINRRQPSYTQRISLRSPGNEDRLVVGGGRRSRKRSEAGGSDAQTITRGGDEEASEISEQSQSVVQPPMKVEVIREGPGDPRYIRTNSGNIRGRGGRKVIRDEDGDSSVAALSRRRSQSLGTEREITLGEEGKLPRSYSAERLTKEEAREQRRLEKKMAALNGERASRSRSKALKSPRESRSARSVSRDGARGAKSGSRNVSGSSDLAQNPLLLEAVEDAIKRLILPQFEALKASSQAGNTTAIDEAASAVIAAEAARTFAEKSNSNDVPQSREGPLLVLQPDVDQGTGHSVILSHTETPSNLPFRSESVRSKGPGFGPGPAPGSDLYDDGPVEPLDALFPNPKQAPPHERIRMPSIPSMTSSYRSEHHHVHHDEIEGIPYPPTAAESGMPMTGHTPPPITMPDAVAPLNISRKNTPTDNNQDEEDVASPRQSVASLRNIFDQKGMIAPLKPQRYGFANSEVSVATASTAPSWHPNKSSRWNHNTVGSRDLGMQSRSDLNNNIGPGPRDDAMNWWFEKDKEIPTRPDTEVDQSVVDQSVVDHSVVDTSIVDGHYDDHYGAYRQEDSDLGLQVPAAKPRAPSALSVPSNRDDLSSVAEIQRIQLDPPDTASHVEESYDRELYENRSPNRDSIPGSFEARHTERVATGQNVKDVGAYASMRSTPVDLPSMQASLHDHLSSVHDQYSQASLRSPQPRAMSPTSSINTDTQPRMTFNAAPMYGLDEPAIGHYASQSDLGQSEVADEDDVVTNPYGADRTSREIAMGDDAMTNPYTDNRLSRDMSAVDDMTTNPYGADRTSREIAMEGGEHHWGYAEDDHTGHNANFGLRAMQAGQSGRDFVGEGQSGREFMGDQESAIDREGMITPLNMQHGDGYMSANRLTPAMDGIESGLHGMTSFGGVGLDDFISEDGDDFMPFRGHVRSGSGNSHGMPSPLYDSAMGHGIDRIQSKDIVALMDHLTVRDAARNARDAEMLMTLVRSAAEMRDSFDDLKKQLAAHSSQMLLEIDQSAEKTVAKIGAPPPPRPMMPLPVSRQIKAPRTFDDEKEEANKKTNVFRRALKGLSMKSSNDLARIEDMLVQLLGEVEGLKAASYAYTESNTASHAGDQIRSQTHSQSLDSQHSQQSYTVGSTNHLASFDYSATAGIGQPIMNSNGDLNYYATGNPAVRQSSNHIDREITPNDDGMRTPRGFRDIQEDPTPMQSIPTIQTIQTPVEATPVPISRSIPQSMDNTPNTGKGKEKRESVPKASRWSETTASTGFKSFFSRKKRGGDNETSRPTSEFEEDWTQAGTAENSPYPPHQPFASPIQEKPSLEANRRSLEIKHPQPRIKKNHHHHLESAAETHVDTQSPTLTQSTTSLNRFIQHGGSYNNIQGLSPMFPDADQASPQNHHASQQYQNQPTISEPRDYDNASPIPPQTATTDGDSDLLTPERKKKQRHKRDETPEERAARKERRRQRHRSRELLGEVPQEADEDMVGSRPASAASRKYGRPPSAASHRSYRNDESSTPTPSRHRTSHLTHITTNTFGFQD